LFLSRLSFILSEKSGLLSNMTGHFSPIVEVLLLDLHLVVCLDMGMSARQN
jgi:hypothetical protein